MDRRELSVNELQKQIGSKHGIDVSIKNLYRIVSQLIESQVLVRRSGKVALNLVWVTHFVRFGDALRQSLLTAGSAVQDLPLEEGSSAEYTADSLVGLDPVWNDTLLQIARISGKGTFYAFNARAWYPLGMKNTELHLYRGLHELGVEPVMLFGGDSFLDQLGLRIMELEGLKAHARPSGSLPQAFQTEGLMLWTGGDYIVESVIPQALSRHFTFFFSAIRSPDQFDIETFSSLFRMRARCSITVRRNAAEAKKWKSLFEDVLRPR